MPSRAWPLIRRFNLRDHELSCHTPHPIQVEAAAAARAAITARLEGLLGADGAILLPSTPTTAPKLGMTLAEIDPLWQRIICLVAPAAEAGLPQVRGCPGFPGACRGGWPGTGAGLPRVPRGEVRALVLRLGMRLAELDRLWQRIGCLLRRRMRPAAMQAGARITCRHLLRGRAPLCADLGAKPGQRDLTI